MSDFRSFRLSRRSSSHTSSNAKRSFGEVERGLALGLLLAEKRLNPFTMVPSWFGRGGLISTCCGRSMTIATLLGALRSTGLTPISGRNCQICLTLLERGAERARFGSTIGPHNSLLMFLL